LNKWTGKTEGQTDSDFWKEWEADEGLSTVSVSNINRNWEWMEEKDAKPCPVSLAALTSWLIGANQAAINAGA
jgi:hypothetical protein